MSIELKDAASIALLAIEAAQGMLQKAQVAGSAVAAAQAEGRTHLTDAEWFNIQQTADGPIDKLREEIAKH